MNMYRNSLIGNKCQFISFVYYLCLKDLTGNTDKCNVQLALFLSCSKVEIADP